MFLLEILVDMIVTFIALFFNVKKNIYLNNLIKGILLSFVFFGLMQIVRVFNNVPFNSVNFLNYIKWSFMSGIGLGCVSLFFDFLETRK
ncbi:MAG: hypothetical protein CSA42_07785 [Gammaproteobacteria bacterium]|nr:MAG: hypothetical protein CSA42_07785 [Gammaproteobacteria bacterium]